MPHNHEVKFGLPAKVRFCTKCVISNQRPNSDLEFQHTIETKKKTIHLDDEGTCDACKQAAIKEQINWEEREKELLQLLDQYRSKDGNYDCIVSGSGGKDSAFQAHVLKYKYGMNPLTVTWSPILYTEYGLKNFENWIDVGGFDNISFRRNGRVMKLLTRLSIENLFHPFQTFILGQKGFAPKMAAKLGIPLIFYGENEAEYGNPIANNSVAQRDSSFFRLDNLDKVSLAGVSVKELREKYEIKHSDLLAFLPLVDDESRNAKVDVRYLGYYLKWVPQEIYYYAVNHTGFQPRPFRSQGTYSKYNSIDDKIDDLHYYTTYIKFGIGRASYEAAQEIRNKHITREEGVALVKRFDGEFPDRYFNEVMDYIEMKPERFMELCDQFRSPHLWAKKQGGDWGLRHTVWGGGVDD